MCITHMDAAAAQDKDEKEMHFGGFLRLQEFIFVGQSNEAKA